MELIKKIKHWLRKKPIVHILSDSHGEVFYKVNFQQFGLKASYCIVQGATASGIANPNSKTQALPIFMKYLQSYVKTNDQVILELGEVDCGFAIWLISEKKNIPIADQTSMAVKNYTDFLKNVSTFTENPLLIVSAILPTIEDGQTFGKVANLRMSVKANLLERTNLTLAFNKKIQEFCSAYKHVFINLDNDLLDKDTLVVNKFFKNEDKKDHHLDNSKLSGLLEAKFKTVFNERLT